jgi:hypothetical protein
VFAQLSEGCNQARLILLPQERHHIAGTPSANSLDQEAVETALSCTASIKCLLRKPLCRLSRLKSTSYKGRGANLPLIVQNSRLFIDDERVELVSLDRGASNQQSDQIPGSQCTTPAIHLGANGRIDVRMFGKRKIAT